MNAFTPIIAELDAGTAAPEHARARGRSRAQFAASAIRRVAKSKAGLRAFLNEGAAASRRGDRLSHDELVVDVRQGQRERARPS